MRLGLVTWSYLAGTVEVEVLARFREPLIAVVAPIHSLAGHPPLTVDDLVREGAPFHQAIWGTPKDARIAPMSELRHWLAYNARSNSLCILPRSGRPQHAWSGHRYSSATWGSSW